MKGSIEKELLKNSRALLEKHGNFQKNHQLKGAANRAKEKQLD